jgi:hypothetical protein
MMQYMAYLDRVYRRFDTQMRSYDISVMGMLPLPESWGKE